MDAISLSALMVDEYSAKILSATANAARSASEIARRYSIPIAPCYRRLHKLEGLGFVRSEGEARCRNGKETRLYRSRVKNVTVHMQGLRLIARIELYDGLVLTSESGP